ncbi:hypothetical protein [Lactovum miscens]|uniref:Uncharacterized protein n=1 Tax=Lactovum miscens TaxID=190387 RepID=A0A841C8N3_9LACT|nr:hypothetical protein [Lactovum miscens]MBB5887759.1 hypothetical protein [Lactovum miscens]
MTKNINENIFKFHDPIKFSDRQKVSIPVKQSDELNVDYISINGNIKKLERIEGES